MKKMFEPLETGNPYRKEYIDSVERVLETLRDEAQARRTEYFRKNYPGKIEVIREKLREKLGWPLIQDDCTITSEKREYVGARDGYNIYRLQYELIRGLRFYGMLFMHEDGVRRPLILAQHGGLGTPEVVGGMLECGTDNYHHMVERLCKLGANVFAPQLLIWDPLRFTAREQDMQGDVNAMRRPLDSMLQQVGSSMTAIELYCISRAIDHLSEEPSMQPGHVGMMGLSYGGFYSMYAAAVDTRIHSALTSCSFNERGRGRRVATDYIWGDSGNYFLDAEIALLLYPRSLRIQVAMHDQILAYEGAKREYERFLSLARELTGDDSWYLFDSFDGRHEFDPNDECLTWLIENC